MVCLLGPHAADGGYANNASGRWILKDLVRDLQPAWVNILRAQQPADALATALEIRRDYPRTGVMVRHMFDHLAAGDERLLTEFPNGTNVQRAAAIYKAICEPYLGLDLVLVVGNEITVADYRVEYVPIFTELMRLASEDGLSLAVGRFPVGHPHHKPYDKDEQFDQLAGLGDALAKHRGHYFSPNWYYTLTWFEGITKGLEFWEFIGKPRIVIGEFGLLESPSSAQRGWQSVGLTAEECADNLVEVAKTYLLPNNIPACWFNIYSWFRSGTFETKKATHNKLIARKGEIQLTIKPVPTLPARGADVWRQARLISTSVTKTQNLRNAPFAVQTPDRPKLEILAAVPHDALCYVWWPGEQYQEDSYVWYGVWWPDAPEGKQVGWMALVKPQLADQFTLLEPEQPGPVDPPMESWRTMVPDEFRVYLKFAEDTPQDSRMHNLIVWMAYILDELERKS